MNVDLEEKKSLYDNQPYTGITKQTKNARLNQHNNAGKGFDDLDIQYEGLTRNQARAIEQYYIENGPNALNKINSISPNNKYYQDAMNWAKQYLGVEQRYDRFEKYKQ